MSDIASNLPETRISTLVGDRLCIACGYNLVGQPILRESHYDMLIVRCPECATVASVQEYPLLGRWANRWAALLTAMWMVVMVVLWLGSSAALFGFAVGSAELAADAYGEVIYERFNAWQTQQTASNALAAATGAAVIPSPGAGGQVVVTRPGGRVVINNMSTSFSSWWQQQDRAGLLADAGGLLGGFNIFVWYLWMWMAIAAAVLGVMWATIMIARGRAGLALWAFIIILTAGAIGLIPIIDWMSRPPSWTRQAASQQIGPLVMGLSFFWGLFWLILGMMIGRPIARALVLLLLPPRMRSTMAFLWLTDGHEPPRLKR